ncbi:hypothetical protein BJ912DRAFT_1066110 [Pholiota molesta]|nr:hypothetical protein BJ912DRAFT_1066110 [Pholiota molesta]
MAFGTTDTRRRGCQGMTTKEVDGISLYVRCLRRRGLVRLGRNLSRWLVPLFPRALAIPSRVPVPFLCRVRCSCSLRRFLSIQAAKAAPSIILAAVSLLQPLLAMISPSHEDPVFAAQRALSPLFISRRRLPAAFVHATAARREPRQSLHAQAPRPPLVSDPAGLLGLYRGWTLPADIRRKAVVACSSFLYI